jgi:hypothetical protein
LGAENIWSVLKYIGLILLLLLAAKPRESVIKKLIESTEPSITKKLFGKTWSLIKKAVKWLINKGLLSLIKNTAIILIGLLLVLLVLGNSEYLRELDEKWFALRLLGLIVLLGYFTNINLISIGRIYGDSLSNAFNIKKSISLADLHNDSNKAKAPYPLFNCCLNLAPQSTKSNLTSDYFLLSPKHMGSEATGYLDSGSLTLSRAMTTSAAAVNTGMGIFSSSITSILIGLFNFRMGALLYNPKNTERLAKKLEVRINNTSSKSFIIIFTIGVLGFLKFYFYRFIASKVAWWPWEYLKSLFSNNSTKDTLLDISDGGHIENLAVYELLKRKCKLIIGIDAGMDAKYEFEDLNNLMKRAKSKLGIEIKFRKNNDPFKIIKPDEYGLSKKQYAVADLYEHWYYDNEDKKIKKHEIPTIIGTYVYVKSSLIENLDSFTEVKKSAYTEEYQAYKAAFTGEKKGADTEEYQAYKYEFKEVSKRKKEDTRKYKLHKAVFMGKREDEEGAETTAFKAYKYGFKGIKRNEKTEENSFEYQVYKYKKYNGDFPHHSTSDQSFEPVQFQAYYDLGQSLCKDVFSHITEFSTRAQIIDEFKKVENTVENNISLDLYIQAWIQRH